MGRVTPVRRQYLELKARYPDAILFFRLGDFYETFDEDAKLVASELDIALTSKPMGGGLRSPLAGVPVRSVEGHLARLVGRGHRVAICEQLERPSASRQLVRRGVVRVVSPGTALEPALLEAGEASACAALWVERGRGGLRLGIAAADITTGSCHLVELPAEAEDAEAGAPALWERAADQLAGLGARELILADSDEETAAGLGRAAEPGAPALTLRPAHEFGSERARRAVARQFAAPAEAFGLEPNAAALRALGALLAYLRRALPEADAGTAEGGAAPQAGPGLRHLAPPVWLDAASRLGWDRATGRALGIVEADGGAGETLMGSLDRCATAPGRRWLRAALAAPLLDLERIGRRLDRVEALYERPALRRALTSGLRGVGDPERLLGRTASALAAPAELRALGAGLIEAERLGRLIVESAPETGDARADETAAPAEATRTNHPSAPEAALGRLAASLGPAPEAARRLLEALPEQPPAEFGRGVVCAGVDADVDRARARADRCRERLAALEATLREESGIAGATIGYHRTFGYQIELSRGQAARAPESWERRQSLRDRERFTEPRLRAVAAELEQAEEELAEAERAAVERLRAALLGEAGAVRLQAGAAARLDAACALAAVAAERAWTRPELDHSAELVIESGRHPIVEARAAQGGFVPNDARLAADGRRAPQLMLVTGPNMAGKSTYLRQAALIAVLAQAGAFVPAARARVGLIDRIFARVGAHDELARGRSTFMVEMLETARLLHGATERSLVLLDEIGRGTSTWDGMAIARAVAEELAGRGERGPRTLFATHFHELTALAGELSRVENAAVQVEETAAGELIFPYRVAPGAADRSYGVQVARQAGLPERVVERAALLLERYEQEQRAGRPERTAAAGPASAAKLPSGLPAGPPAGPQLTLMPPPLHPIVRDLADLDVDGLTPLEAISALYALCDQAHTELRERTAGERGAEPATGRAALGQMAEAGS